MEPVVSSGTVVTLRPHKWHFWNLHLLLPLSKTLMWLLQKVTPEMQEKNIKTPGDLKYPCSLGRAAINNQHLCTRQVHMELDKEHPARSTHGHTWNVLQL